MYTIELSGKVIERSGDLLALTEYAGAVCKLFGIALTIKNAHGQVLCQKRGVYVSGIAGIAQRLAIENARIEREMRGAA